MAMPTGLADRTGARRVLQLFPRTTVRVWQMLHSIRLGAHLQTGGRLPILESRGRVGSGSFRHDLGVVTMLNARRQVGDSHHLTRSGRRCQAAELVEQAECVAQDFFASSPSLSVLCPLNLLVFPLSGRH